MESGLNITGRIQETADNVEYGSMTEEMLAEPDGVWVDNARLCSLLQHQVGIGVKY